jgi:hypothetical protein
MAQDLNVTVDCQMVGEFVAEAEVPPDLVGTSGEVCPTQIVADYTDFGIPNHAVKEFTVLLRDNRIVTVRGSGLKYIRKVTHESYAIVAPATGGEVIVALFPIGMVTGIFSGELRVSRESA